MSLKIDLTYEKTRFEDLNSKYDRVLKTVNYVQIGSLIDVVNTPCHKILVFFV